LEGISDTYNENETEKVLEDMRKRGDGRLLDEVYEVFEKYGKYQARKALDMLSGSFLSETLVMTATDKNQTPLYAKLKQTTITDGVIAGSDPQSHAKPNRNSANADSSLTLISNSIWLESSMSQLKLSHQSDSYLGITTDNGSSIRVGALFAAQKDRALGIFVAASNDLIKQAHYNKAFVNSIEGGVYGGLFRESSEWKFHLSVGQHDFATTRNIFLIDDYETKAQFSALSFKAGAQLALISKYRSAFDLKPYVGFKSAVISNKAITEHGGDLVNLEIKGNNYQSLTGFAGLGLEHNRQDFSWYLKGELGYLYEGNNASSEYEVSFVENENSKAMKIRGLEVEPLTFGINFGVDLALTDTVNLYADGQYAKNANVAFAQGNVGIKMMFGLNDQLKQYQEKQRKIRQAQIARENKIRQAQIAKENLLKKQKAQSDLIAHLKRQAEKDKLTAQREFERQQLLLQRQTQKQKLAAQKQAEKERLMEQRRQEKLQAQQRRQKAIQSFRLKAASFGPNSAELSPEAKHNIRLIAQKILESDFKLITAEGHSDASGNIDQNLLLSQSRAQSLAQELIRNGIPKEKVRFIGLGSQIPISNNATIQGRQENRRAEIFVE
jgi:outer membrane protein OmpA-like peptidoglycan-associated protein